MNGKLVSLDYTLKTGDQVEILAAKQGGPSRDWLNRHLGLVKTQRAKSKIRAWFKHQNREQNLAQGKEVWNGTARLGIQQYDLEKLARGFDYRSLEDLYVAVRLWRFIPGTRSSTLSQREKRMISIFEIKPSTQVKDITENRFLYWVCATSLLTSPAAAIPVPGDAIVGYITRGAGATIHRQDCPNILRMKDRDRIVRVAWGNRSTPSRLRSRSRLMTARD